MTARIPLEDFHDDIIRMYVDEKRSFKEVAEQLSIILNKRVGAKPVTSYLKNRNIFRSKSEQSSLSSSKRVFRKEKPCEICKKAFVPKTNGKKCYECVPNEEARKRLECYGITQVNLDTMIQFQNNSCAICKRNFSEIPRRAGHYKQRQDFNIDHDHKTGKVRGLLCTSCNSGLGHVEREWFVASALEYLRCPPFEAIKD